MDAAPGWNWDPQRLVRELEAAGFEADPRDAELDGAGSIRARRERAGRALLLAIDAGGRFRATATRVRDERGRRTRVAGRPARVVTAVTETTTVVGTMRAPDELGAVLAFLDGLGRGEGENG
jgi:hypothetical protein